jgi:hypothetical protein
MAVLFGPSQVEITHFPGWGQFRSWNALPFAGPRPAADAAVDAEPKAMTPCMSSRAPRLLISGRLGK